VAQFGRNPARSDTSRSPSVDRGIEGKEEGEEARCTDGGEWKTVKRGVASVTPFYGGAGGEEKGRGSGSVPRGGRRRSGEGRGGVRCHVGWHGMGAVDLGRSDSGRRRMLRGRGGRAMNRGGGRVVNDVGTTADMWYR
jgi:hypothetical protein